MTTERINIIVSERGARVVERNINDIGKSAERAASPLGALKTAVLALAGSAVLGGIIRTIDQFNNLQNQLRLVTTGTENLATVTKELGRIANETRSDFGATAELYSRVANATKEMGLSQRETLNFTRSLNQAVILSGASSSEAAAGLRQLSQGLAAGALRGDELISVMENFPTVADVIATQLGVTRGELRALGAEGKITADVVIDAFKAAEEELNGKFGQTVATIGQAWTVFKNNLTLALAEFDKATGFSTALANALLWVANNLDKIIPLLVAIGAAVAVAFAPGWIATFIGWMKTLWALVLANPFTALAAVIAAVIVALYSFRDEIKLGIDETTTLGDLLRSIWESVGPVISGIATLIGDFFSWISGKSADAYNNMIGHTDEYGKSNESMWLKALRTTVQVFDMIGGVIRGFFVGLWEALKKAAELWGKTFENMANVATAALSFDGAGVKAALESQVELASTAGAEFSDAFFNAFTAEQLSQADSGLEAWLDGRIARAQEIGRERLAGLDASGGLNPGSGGGGGGGGVDPNAAKAARELESSLNDLLNTLNPVRAAEQELASVEMMLNDAVRAGLIERNAATEALDQYRAMMFEALKPFEAMTQALDEEIRLAGMLGTEREIEIALLQQVEQLKRSGVTVTDEMTESLREQLAVLMQTNAVSREKEAILAASVGAMAQQAQTQITAMKELLAEGALSWDEANLLIMESNSALFDSTWAAQEAQIERLTAYYAQIDALRQADLISEQQASEARAMLDYQLMEMRLSKYSDMFGQLATLSRSGNKKLAAIGKAAAIAQATIDGVLGVQKALASYPPPFNFAMAAVVGVTAAANVAQIASQPLPGFRTGGNFTVGGSGGQDSQTVAFRATPGERVSINTPSQAKALERLAERASEPVVRSGDFNVTIVQQGRPDRRTSEQQARDVRRAAQREFQRNN